MLGQTSNSRGLSAWIARSHSGGQREKSMNEAHRLKERAALASIAVSTLMTAAKFAAGIASGSLAVLSEAGHNLGDVAATILTYFAIRIANKPADEDHQFGHAKVEALAALVETGFLVRARRLYPDRGDLAARGHDISIEPRPIVFAVLIVSMIVDFVRWLSLKRIAATTKSEALAADALHFSSDIVSSALALCGIAAVLYGYPQGDALAALGLAAFIGVAGFKIGRRTVNTLVDTAPKGLTAQIRSIAQSVPGVIEVEALRLRPAGAEVVGDIAITVSRTLPLEKAAAIEANVAAAIAAAPSRGRLDGHVAADRARRRNDPRTCSSDRGQAPCSGSSRDHAGNRRPHVDQFRRRARRPHGAWQCA